MELLNENEVVDAVAAHLAATGYKIEQALHGHQRGVDIIARHSKTGVIYVEAKGGTSSRVGSANHGKPMTPREVRINIAEAFYTAAVAATTRPDAGSGQFAAAIAFHDDARHRRYVDPLRPALDRLGIGVFWVTPPNAVTVEGLRAL
jgi:Holliday junction resolvase-like predicted endonuclease